MKFIVPTRLEVETFVKKAALKFDLPDEDKRCDWKAVYNVANGKLRMLEDDDIWYPFEEMFVADALDVYDFYAEFFGEGDKSLTKDFEEAVNEIYGKLTRYLNWDCFWEFEDEDEENPCDYRLRLESMVKRLNEEDFSIVNGFVRIVGHEGPLSRCPWI